MNDPQKKCSLGTVSKNISGWFKPIAQGHMLGVCQTLSASAKCDKFNVFDDSTIISYIHQYDISKVLNITSELTGVSKYPTRNFNKLVLNCLTKFKNTWPSSAVSSVSDYRTRSLVPAQSDTFMKIYHEIISTVILLLPLIQENKRNYVHEILVNHLVKFAQEKVRLGQLN